MTVGPLLAAGGMFWLSRITEHSTYAGGLLGPMMLTGLGMGLTFVPLSLVALAKVPNKDTGVASSLLNTGQQVGGSIGLAILGTVAWSAVASNTKSAIAATHGAHLSAARADGAGQPRARLRVRAGVPGVGGDLAPRGDHRAGDDPGQARGSILTRLIVIDSGKIIADGPRDQILGQLSAASQQGVPQR